MASNAVEIAALLEGLFGAAEFVPYLRVLDDRLASDLPDPANVSPRSWFQAVADGVVRRGLEADLGELLARERPGRLPDISRALGFDRAGRFESPRPPVVHLVGRVGIVEEVSAQLVEGRSVLLHGIVGVGKTQVALAVAAELRARGIRVHWVRASSKDDLARQLQCRVSGDPNKADPDAAIRVALRQLALAGAVLVLDNADDPSIADCLPLSGTLLVVSRAPRPWPGALVSVAVQPLPLENGIELLQATSGDQDVVAARDVARWLGGHALALAQAGHYCASTGCRLADYRGLVDAYGVDALGTDGHPDHPEPLTRQVRLALGTLNRRNPLAARLVGVVAHLGPGEIPRPVLLGLPGAGPLEIGTAISEGARAGLVTVGPGSVELHALLAEIVRGELPGDDLRSVALLAACGALRNAVHEATDLSVRGSPAEVVESAWDKCTRILPHAVATLAAIAPSDLSSELVIETLLHVLDKVDGWGRWRLGANLAVRALAAAERGGGDRQVLRWLQNRTGVLLQKAHRNEEALAIFERMLREPTGSPADEAQCLHNLGFVLGTLGRLPEAVANLERALEIREQLDGPESESVASALSSLSTYVSLSDPVRARRLQERAHRIRMATEERGSPKRLMSLANASHFLLEAGDAAGALRAAEDALAESSFAERAGHPVFAGLLIARASAREALGRLPEAQEDLRVARSFVASEDRDPGFTVLCAELGARISFGLGDYLEAAADLDTLADLVLPHQPRLAGQRRFEAAVARVHGGKGAPAVEQALHCLEHLRLDETEHFAALGALAFACFQANDYPSALPLYDRMVEQARSSGKGLAWWLNGRGAVLLGLGRTAEAREPLGEAMKHLQGAGAAEAEVRVECSVNLGQLEFSTGNLTEALRWYLEAESAVHATGRNERHPLFQWVRDRIASTRAAQAATGSAERG